MIEFPQDGQISIGDLKAFVEAKLGEEAVSDESLNALFEKMEEYQFILPNAEVDENSEPQGFIAPHKMSETYGAQAPIKEEGINYGDHEFELEMVRMQEGSIGAAVFSDTGLPIDLLSDTSGNNFIKARLFSKHKLFIPFGDDGLFLVDDNGDTILGDWVFQNASITQTQGYSLSFVPSFNLVTVNCDSISDGMYIEFEVEPGEIYYFEALDFSFNARFRIGNAPFSSEYVDISGKAALFDAYIPTESTIYISITPIGDPENLDFKIGLIRTYKFFQHGRYRYAEIEAQICNADNLPLPRLDTNNIGYDDALFKRLYDESLHMDDFGSLYQKESSGDLHLDLDTITSLENDFGDVHIESQYDIEPNYLGYTRSHQTTFLTDMQLNASYIRDPDNNLTILNFQSYTDHQTFSSTVEIPLRAGDVFLGSIGNVNFTFKKSHSFRIVSAAGLWIILNQDFDIVSGAIFNTKTEALNFWNTNYNEEGQFYLSDQSEKLFDWLHVFHYGQLGLLAALDTIFVIGIHEIFYNQWMNYYQPPRELTGQIRLQNNLSYIRGKNTLFTYELSQGDVIMVGSNKFIVENIESNKFLTITKNIEEVSTDWYSANYVKVKRNSYPRYTAFPQYGYENTNMKINPFYSVAIEPEQQNQINLAIAKVESIVKNSIDVNMFFMPYAYGRSGGVLAAARPNNETSSPNALFKNPNYTSVINHVYGSREGGHTRFDSRNGCFVKSIFTYGVKIEAYSTFAGVVGINLNGLIVGEFYRLMVDLRSSGGSEIMLSIKNADTNEIYAHRLMPSEDYKVALSFQAEAVDNVLELTMIHAEAIPGDVYIEAGSNIIETTNDTTGQISPESYILINGRIVKVSSVSPSEIIIDKSMSLYWQDTLSTYPYNVFGGKMFLLSQLTFNDDYYLYSIEVDQINPVYVRDQIHSGAVFIDQIDLNRKDANFILADGKSGLYYIILHELLHALGIARFYWYKHELSNGAVSYSTTYPSQYFGRYGVEKYKEIIQEKIDQLNLSNTLADYYTDSVPAQGGGAHLAEYAKLVDEKVQPSLPNELMSPAYNFDRAILSKITLGFLEDLGYEVDYDQIESSYLLEMSENTDISNDSTSSEYDKIIVDVPSTKKRRTCPHCDHSSENET